MFTNRADTEPHRRLEHVERGHEVRVEDRYGEFCVGSGMAAACTTASAPRTAANASPASVRSTCM
jgi:hypothetical protein